MRDERPYRSDGATVNDSDRSALRAATTRKIERLRMERDHHERLALLAGRELELAYGQYDRI